MKPLPFTAEMALAAMLGPKRETRRPLKYQPILRPCPDGCGSLPPGDYWFWDTPTRTNGRNLWGGWATVEEMKANILAGGRQAPFGLPGDWCWLREPGRIVGLAYSVESVPLPTIKYLADKAQRVVPLPNRLGVEDRGSYPSWLKVGHGIPNGIFREAARFKTLILEVRVERLQDITEEGAIAEGIERGKDFFGCPTWKNYGKDADCCFPDDPVGSYQSLWDSIYGKRPGLAWADNPWVTVTKFNDLQALPLLAGEGM